ncbi:prolyl aminopeptidase [Ruminococcaceae bacterium OttesenSCG-928-N02]|nr:prolyl aminopeptidase [Ruminococcaceae bacterium OttesenSCG-928-N02]
MSTLAKNYQLMTNNRLYPCTAPYNSGMLPVGDGHTIYWEACGNPAGKPVLILHGGPGSGAGAPWRRYFNPAVYKIILFDQRGCGRSTPHAGDTQQALHENTTWNLMKDIEKLRAFFKVDRWMLFAGSWGTTLAFAYAVSHPQCITQMVLWAPVTTRKEEVDWLTWGMGRIFPEEFDELLALLPGIAPGDNILLAYNKLLLCDDPAVQDRAALAWCAWEDRLVSLGGEYPRSERYQDARFRLGFTRLVTHYFGHYAFLPDDYITGQLTQLQNTPLVMVRGRLDICAPLKNPWQIHKALPRSDLYVLDDEGHGGKDTMEDILVGAVAYFEKW